MNQILIQIFFFNYYYIYVTYCSNTILSHTVIIGTFSLYLCVSYLFTPVSVHTIYKEFALVFWCRTVKIYKVGKI